MKQAIRRILFATDFSESSQQAQHYAMLLALPLQAEMHALHVTPDPLPLPSITGLEDKPTEARLKQSLARDEKRLAAQMAEDSARCSNMICEVRLGDAAREIKNYADTHDIDLIVLGTHGRSGLTHALIGSVAEKLVRTATCPVMTVHAQIEPR